MTLPDRAAALMQARIAAYRNQVRFRAGSLIISVFGDAVAPRGSRVWIGSLIRLLEPLGINERLTRTAVSRLAQQKWLRIEREGRRANYLLTPDGQRRFEEASRAIYASQARPWDGRWRLMLLVRELDGAAREPLRRALAWQGFGQIGSGCFVHPSADPEQTLRALATEGLPDAQQQLMPLVASNPCQEPRASDAELVRRAWDLEALEQHYAEFDARYRPILNALQAQGTVSAKGVQIDPERAFLLRTLLIHDWRRLLLRDPELPDVLLPAGWHGQPARQLIQALYRLLLAPSERHLDAQLQLADARALRARTDLGKHRFAPAANAQAEPVQAAASSV
ncbi:MAG: Phenylacetic acid degradation operon negative regulatory protein PaaX [Burkholderiaceae bacterium]|jgi:phenylacetic acid degradation operon negative regulatory protein|nr:MAG: Phenylacetic acid degradation operon negative regulatory protein PaaX [Burkholderiaceae bacterium]